MNTAIKTKTYFSGIEKTDSHLPEDAATKEVNTLHRQLVRIYGEYMADQLMTRYVEGFKSPVTQAGRI